MLITNNVLAIKETEASSGILSRLKNASKNFGKTLKKYSHSITRKKGNEEDKRKFSRAATVMVAALTAYLLVGGAIAIGTKLQKRPSGEPIPQNVPETRAKPSIREQFAEAILTERGNK